MKNHEITQKKHWMPAIVLILGIVSIGIFVFIEQVDKNLQTDFAYANALMDLQIEVAGIHLMIHESITNGTSLDKDLIWDRFDKNRSIIETLLIGGDSEYGLKLVRQREMGKRKELENLKSMMAFLKSGIFGTMSIDSEWDAKFNQVFLEFQQKARSLETALEKDLSRNYMRNRNLYILLFCSWLFIIGLATTGLWRQERKRREAELELDMTNRELKVQAEQLEKHQLHLNELVDARTGELTTANKVLHHKILEHQKAVVALEESRNQFEQLSREFHALLDAIPDFLVLLSPDLKVRWANRNVALVFGKSIAEMGDQYCSFFWESDPGRCDDCPAARTLCTGKEESAQISKSDGHIWDIRTFPIKDEQGAVRNVIEIARDVTEKMTLQAEALRVAHLAAMGELAAGVAHEVNNPINGIINCAQILIDNSRGTDEGADIAGRIIKEGRRIATIVASLLSFAHKNKTEKVPVPLEAIFSDVLALLGQQLEKDGIDLNLCIPDKLPVVTVNTQQMIQVFLNIINNSRYALNLKYPGADQRKILEIIGEEATVDGSAFLRTTFHDHGVGIPAAILDKVKNPFFSTKPKGIGTGLGLSISHGIIEEHGGKLILESVEGEFNKVHVVLPVGG